MKLAIQSVLAAGALLAAGICSAQGTWQPAMQSSNRSVGSEVEVIPLLVPSDNMPSCPAGYSSAWSQSMNGCSNYSVFNIAGSKISFLKGASGGWGVNGFSIDGVNFVAGLMAYCQMSSPMSWSANLCVKD